MLFNSYEFIFVFLPLTLAAYAFLSRFDARQHSLLFLVIASLCFYGWWNPAYLALLGVSLLVNYGLGSALQGGSSSRLYKSTVLVGGLLFNLLLLGYYKYAGFILQIVSDASGSAYVWEQVVLPLAISFYTFQQLTYLIDAYAGKVEKAGFIEYALFVTFFPQLIAGPIVHHKEMMPQFRNLQLSVSRKNIQIGLTLFIIGLFKKTVLADSIAVYVSPIYVEAATGDITFLQAWIASLGFTLQIYFDFSGYSDMALGAARMFGIILPMNFNSPLKAANIIEFWSRWHITLTRFLTAYIYNPIALRATRKAIMGGYGHTASGRSVEFLITLALPTLITMFISGLWHGAGYQYLLWGSLHGMFLVINHSWRRYVVTMFADKVRYERVFRPYAMAITLACVCLAMLFFRANDAGAGYRMARALLGLNGLTVPEGILVHLGALADALASIGIVADNTAGSNITYGMLYCVALLTLSLFMPNSLDLMRRCQPVLEKISNLEHKGLAFSNPMMRRLYWVADIRWALLIAMAAALAIMSMQGLSVFLYWQF